MLERALVTLVSVGVAMTTVGFVSDSVLASAFCLDPDRVDTRTCDLAGTEHGLDRLLGHLSDSG